MAPRGKHTPYTYRVWSLSVVQLYIRIHVHVHVHVYVYTTVLHLMYIHGRMTMSVVISSCSILCVLTVRNRLRDGATMKRRGWPTVRETTRL